MHDHEALAVIDEGARRGVGALRSIREHLGWSIDALAEKSGFDPVLLAACEDHEGVAAPAPCFKEALADALGVPHEVLFSLKFRAAA
jgi:transcriptional regulator with XRE-family HTH domain